MQEFAATAVAERKEHKFTTPSISSQNSESQLSTASMRSESPTEVAERGKVTSHDYHSTGIDIHVLWAPSSLAGVLHVPSHLDHAIACICKACSSARLVSMMAERVKVT